MEQFRQDPLENGPDQIRLLQISPAGKHEPISVTLNIYERSCAPEYAALSYNWGDGVLSKRILANGSSLDVTENCWYALGQLQLQGLYACYWIDSICINQAHLPEKSDQVDKMADTHRQASCVLVSLGRHTEASALLFRLVSKHSLRADCSEGDADPLVEPWLQRMSVSTVEKLMHAITDLGNVPYWSRLWTVQEFALPPLVTILCGTSRLEWYVVPKLLSMLCRSIKVNKDWLRAQMSFEFTENGLRSLPMAKTNALRQVIRDSTHSVSLASMVLKLGKRDCVDPRDRIFGLISRFRQKGNGDSPLRADLFDVDR